MENSIEIPCPNGFAPTGYRLLIQSGDSMTVEIALKSTKKYRTPVLPDDYGKKCEFSEDGSRWCSGELTGWVRFGSTDKSEWRCSGGHYYTYCRIEVEGENA